MKEMENLVQCGVVPKFLKDRRMQQFGNYYLLRMC